jgi:nitroreductase
MNETMKTIHNRKSIRAYQESPIPAEAHDMILNAALRAPTAGNMMLYSIIEVTDRQKKERLAETCDHQPFIATAPMVLLFLADYRRWTDLFAFSGVDEAFCSARGLPQRGPEEGDLFLACCDALIAAQTAVIAAESMGIGSCYIGDIMENYEVHREMFDLPDSVFPITLLCFGYATERQASGPLSSRLPKEQVVFENQYHRLDRQGVEAMEEMYIHGAHPIRNFVDGAGNLGQHFYIRKTGSDFMAEMNRSVRAIMKAWRAT